MRVLFLGTSPFAVPTLQSLLQASQHEVLGVVTQPDRPQGRGGKIVLSPVKVAALAEGLTLYQPEKVRTKEFRQIVSDLAPDVLVVAAFGQIISQRMLNIPRYGGINVHGSLLPRWRGAAPMQYSLMAGDAETGVTTMQMDAGLDTGDILLQASLPLVDIDNLGTLELELAELGASLLLKTLAALERGDCPRIPQEESLVTLAPALPPTLGALDWTLPALTLHNLVRGITPKPGAYTFWQGKRIKILQTSLGDGLAIEPGMVKNIGSGGITIGTGAGSLRLLVVQPESKGRMAADAWARGARIAAGQPFAAREQGEEHGSGGGTAGTGDCL